VAIAELRREGLPHVPAAATVELFRKQKKLLEARGKFSRNAGDEYLNWQFGWAPIVSDLRKFARSIKDSNEIVDQLHRDSGQNVRRRYEFPVTSSSTNYFNEPSSSRTPCFDGDMGNCDVWMMGSDPVTFKVDVETSRKRWFAGCYTYYTPPADDLFGKAKRFEQEANVLLGTRITPEVVWNLAPWSWAADWFANIGDVATNLSYFGQDGLAMRYGYIMERETNMIRSSMTCRVNLTGASNTRISLTENLGSTSFQRRYATPWGFGLTVEAFTPRQTAITVALGLTRGNRS
jgi:hypothetical protein